MLIHECQVLFVLSTWDTWVIKTEPTLQWETHDKHYYSIVEIDESYVENDSETGRLHCSGNENGDCIVYSIGLSERVRECFSSAALLQQ